MAYSLTDTIAAPISGTAGGAVQLVRISGPKTSEILLKLLDRSEAVLSTPRKLFLRNINDADGRGLDEGLVCFFEGESSFTGEDSAEFHLHGSPYILKAFLETLICFGARYAEPGEFTKRAYLHGKVDLAQAEAVADLVAAETSAQAKLAKEQLSGRLSSAISDLGSPLRETLAEIEAYIDFPEEGIEPSKSSAWKLCLDRTKTQIETYISSYSRGKVHRDGAQIVLAGLPNAGKSTLMNALVGHERAIVTDVPGTTRDAIEERISVDGVLAYLWDTAGLVKEDQDERTIDVVESKGVEISWRKLAAADIVLYLVDHGQDLELQLEHLKKVEEMASGEILVLLTKTETVTEAGLNEIRVKYQTLENSHAISALTEHGIDELLKLLALKLRSDISNSSLLICNARHKEALENSLLALEDSIQALESQAPAEFVSFDLRRSISELNEIIGTTPTEDILGLIFSKFCIGK